MQKIEKTTFLYFSALFYCQLVLAQHVVQTAVGEFPLSISIHDDDPAKTSERLPWLLPLP
jgi:hypothetical protein